MKLTANQIRNLSEIQQKYLQDLELDGELNKVSSYRGATRVCYGDNEVRFFYKKEFFSKDQAKSKLGYDAWEWRGSYYPTMKDVMNLIDKQEEADE